MKINDGKGKSKEEEDEEDKRRSWKKVTTAKEKEDSA